MGARPVSTAVLSFRPRIAVTRRIPRQALDLLASEADVWVPRCDRVLSDGELRRAVVGADAVITMLHDRIDAAFIDAAPDGLRCVANVAVGYDNVDVSAATERKIVVTNTPGVLTDATADLAMCLMLAITRRLGEGERLLRARRAWSWHMFFHLGTSLRGKTLGIVGLGQIGQATARRAMAFGMQIAYSHPRRVDAHVEEALGGAAHLPLEDLLAAADVVSLHCPLNQTTRHLIGERRLRLMGPDAYLINTSRGAVVDEAALVAALRERTIAGAALDVFEHEPELDPGLLELDNVVVAPHLGSATIETRTAMALLAAQNALAVTAGRPALTPVNPDAARV